ncbi:MAG TPA: glycosyltransferase, partial [Chitinophagaceae bacterium]
DKTGNGRSRYSFFKLIGLATTLLIIYSTLPLRLMIWFGLLSAVGSFGLGIYFLIQKLTVGSAIGFSSLIVTMTFTGGIILLSLGVLGEYIARIYTMNSGRKAFIIKATV